MLPVTYEQINNLLRVEDLFEPVKQAFIDYNSSSLIGIPVSLLHFPSNADTHIKTAAIKGYDYFSIKVVSMFPNNVEQNLSPYSGAIFLFDGKTGFPVAILNDKGIITNLRTAAAGAIITDYVTSKSSTSVAVIGTGVQAYHQVFSLGKLRPIDKLAIYGRNKAKSLLLKEKLTVSFPDIKINLVDTLEKTVKDSEIIITTTSSKIPFIKGEWLQKGQHITAVGSDDIFKNEIDSDCFNYADSIFLDSLELNKKYGEFSHAYKSSPNLIDKTVEFGVAFQNNIHANSKNKTTIAKLVGVGIQDLASSLVIMSKLMNSQ
jgi:ornithine cyclodeaminase